MSRLVSAVRSACPEVGWCRADGMLRVERGGKISSCLMWRQDFVVSIRTLENVRPHVLRLERGQIGVEDADLRPGVGVLGDEAVVAFGRLIGIV